MVRRKTILRKQVSASVESDSKTVISVRGHTLIMDETWGTNEGPSPVETMLASQAGCLNVIGQRVANDYDYDIAISEIDIEGELNIKKADGESDEPRAGIQELEVTIHIESDEDEETIQQWIAMTEERCPVTDNLVNETPCTISLEVD